MMVQSSFIAGGYCFKPESRTRRNLSIQAVAAVDLTINQSVDIQSIS
jgi:hypothetical protein